MADRTTSDIKRGPVAQMVEQRPCKSQVAGSIPGQDLQLSPWLFLPVDDYDRGVVVAQWWADKKFGAR